MITVIVPHRNGQQQAWSAERMETPTAIGVRIARGGKTGILAFRKANVAGAASIAGRSFDNAVLVDSLR
jgi:hypothetical protein